MAKTLFTYLTGREIDPSELSWGNIRKEFRNPVVLLCMASMILSVCSNFSPTAKITGFVLAIAVAAFVMAITCKSRGNRILAGIMCAGWSGVSIVIIMRFGLHWPF